ncbi:MAG TPA: serine/threonine-protein kinase [Azospira sp.]|nr:serine/threonine-protein kinase [Azospira sp.]
MAEAMPQKLGKYEVRRELGRGAMGVVYEGFDPGIARRVALKTVRRDQLEKDEAQELLSRFKREAQAAGRLSHPNIVAIYEYGEEGGESGGTAFIAMEYVEGRELKDYFDKSERFPLAEIGRLMGELLSALDHAHGNGIVHRDIKPANIFILHNGQAKVGDFGIARIESSNLTQVGSVLGTPAYMSPEQFMGQSVDGRSDLFSAGVLLYQFLTGEKPFTGQLTTIMHKVLKEEPIAPSELNVQVPRHFDAVVRKALAKRPDQRFQSAREFAAALQAAVHTLPQEDATLVGDDRTLVSAQAEATLVAAPTAAPGRGDATLATAASAASPGAPAGPATAEKAFPPAPAAGRSRRPYALAAGTAVLLLAGIGALLLRPGGSGPLPAPAAAPTAAAQAGSDGTIVISAVGVADPSDARLAGDPGLLQAALREDVRRQLVEKAVALNVQPASFSRHYDLVAAKLLSRSGDFIESVLQEEAPHRDGAGLATLNTRAVVKVREVQKSLNQMSENERVDFIRNNGDPKISVAIATRGEAGEAKRSAIAENLLKERVQSFGFRTWGEEAKAGQKGADFAIEGEARLKKLSATLPASGLTIEKYVVTSWTVKCIDKASGEEIYFNTTLPQNGSWATEEAALKDVGRLVGEEFSKNFFLQHFRFAGQKVRFKFAGLPDQGVLAKLQQEMTGLRAVLGTRLEGNAVEAELSGSLPAVAELAQATVLAPLNRKLGQSCLSVVGTAGNEVTVGFAPACAAPATLSRLDDSVPAALFEAPVGRRSTVVKNPALLKKLEI